MCDATLNAMSITTGDTVTDVRAFGARGNGHGLDTAAIQAAIDACAARGGGQVLLHAGTFLTGTLRLRSHVTLHLTSSAVLLGSPDIGDYQADARQHYAPGIIGTVLVFADDCEHVGITGAGTINGSGAAFPRAMATSRPVLVRFRDCRHVVMRDCTLRDGASWAVHAVGCRHARFEDLTIDNLLHVTSDGLDIDGCEQVFIARCAIASGDDAIALKATQPGKPCRDIIISDCRLSSYCQAIRVGPESLADFARIAVSNCVVHDTGMGGICLQVAHGGHMRDLLFDNIVMDNVCNPISVRLGGWRDGDDNVRPWFLDDSRWAEGRLTDVRFSNIRARVPRYYLEGTPKESRTFLANEKTAITVTGTTATRPARITFDGVDITFAGGGDAKDAARAIPELDRQYPTPFMHGVPPAYGLYARHVDDLALHHVRFRLASPDARPAVVCEDVADADLSGLRADASTMNPEGAIR